MPDETTEKIKQIMRRDLMLASDLEIEDDTPLFGGELDLDSLDALLLLGSLEKEFGFKAEREGIKPETFADVRSISAFINEKRSGAA